jgi:hypothetical protein
MAAHMQLRESFSAITGEGSCHLQKPMLAASHPWPYTGESIRDQGYRNFAGALIRCEIPGSSISLAKLGCQFGASALKRGMNIPAHAHATNKTSQTHVNQFAIQNCCYKYLCMYASLEQTVRVVNQEARQTLQAYKNQRGTLRHIQSDRKSSMLCHSRGKGGRGGYMPCRRFNIVLNLS